MFRWSRKWFFWEISNEIDIPRGRITAYKEMTL